MVISIKIAYTLFSEPSSTTQSFATYPCHCLGELHSLLRINQQNDMLFVKRLPSESPGGNLLSVSMWNV